MSKTTKHARLLQPCLLALSLILPLTAQADITAQVGNVTIVLPDPNGLVPTKKASPNLFAIGTLVVPPRHNVLDYYTSEADVQASLNDQPLNMGKTAAVVVDRDSEYKPDVPESYFNGLKEYIRKNIDSTMDVVRQKQAAKLSDPNDEQAQNLKKIDMTLDFSKPKSLGMIDESKNHFTSAFIMKISAERNGVRVEPVLGCTMSIVLVKGKLLNVLMYHDYQSDYDLKALYADTKDWVRRIAAANGTPL
jgi:hypothetical protein